MTNEANDCSKLHTRHPGPLDQITAVLQRSNSNASACSTRAQLALPCAECPHCYKNAFRARPNEEKRKEKKRIAELKNSRVSLAR